MNWIEVIDTAIKIGLGALIAGFFTLVGFILQHRHKLEENVKEEDRNSIKQTSAEFELALSGLLKKALVEAKYAEEKLSEGYDEDEWWQRIEVFEEYVDDTVIQLNLLEGRLLLAGCPLAAN